MILAISLQIIVLKGARCVHLFLLFRGRDEFGFEILKGGLARELVFVVIE